MGMKSRLVSNRQITASSTFRTWGIEAFTWHPHYARLDKQGKTNAWTAATNNQSEWLQVGEEDMTELHIVVSKFVHCCFCKAKLFLCPQVDLQSPKKITGIITQGAKDFGSIQFVTAFKVAHSDDGQSWTIVKDETTKIDKVSPAVARNTQHINVELKNETELIPVEIKKQNYSNRNKTKSKFQIEKIAPEKSIDSRA